MKNKTNRRNFLKTSAVLGASIFLPNSITMATGGSSDDKRIIVIGAGLAGDSIGRVGPVPHSFLSGEGGGHHATLPLAAGRSARIG